MPGTVTLNVIKGKLKGKAFRFEGHSLCVIGRASDCNLRLPDDGDHPTISRYHCLLDIYPPRIRVRDFGSYNGTYVNGTKIGQREKGRSPQTVDKEVFPEFDLQHGDEITLGLTTLKVETESPGEVNARHVDHTPESTDMGLPGSPIESVLEHARFGRHEKPSIEGFTVLEKLGEGGTAKVYLARDDETDEQVALKILMPQVAIDDLARAMFLREVRNTQVLRHPNVVALRSSGSIDGTFYVALEYCNSGSIEDRINSRDGALPMDEAIPFALQVLDGIEYAHNVEISAVNPKDGSLVRTRGLVHRDLKPGNIYLSEAGGALMAKIGDFGLSKAFDLAGMGGGTVTGSTAGTPLYMPRQQILDYKFARPEVDVWALAASFYKMLTGITPRTFQRGDDPWLVALTNPAVPIRQINPQIPERLAQVIDEALIDNPEIRFKSAAQLKQAIQAAL